MEGFMIPIPERARMPEQEGVWPHVDAQMATLREVAACYGAMVEDGCAFKPGDVIILREPHRAEFSMSNKPCIVLEVFDVPVRCLEQPHGTIGDVFCAPFGAYFDMRIAYFATPEYVSPFVAESFRFRAWE